MQKHIIAAILGLVSFLAISGCDNSDNNVVVNPNNPNQPAPAILNRASASSNVVLDVTDSTLYAVNAGSTGAAGSLTVMRVRRDQADIAEKVGEVVVGNFPQSVAVNPAGTRAYVTNGADNTVSVIDLSSLQVVSTIRVGSEPRGCCLSPGGNRLYVANFSDGTMSVIDTASNTVLQTVDLTLNGTDIAAPFAICCTNDLDADENDERIIVTDFWGRARAGLPPEQVETFNDGREGRVATVDAASLAVTNIIALNPIASGFTSDRTAFAGTVYAGSATEPEDAFFNQLGACTIDPADPSRLYVVGIGASPEPPLRFNVNVQALVGVVNLDSNSFDAANSTNLNRLIAPETQPANIAGSLVRAFAGDTTSLDIRNGNALFISRAGSYALRGQVAGGAISLNNGANTPAVRFPTGNIPTGVVINSNATRAYVNNEIDATVTPINLETNQALADAELTGLPAVGSQAHNSRIGALVFFTGMGVQPDGLTNMSVRDIDTLANRGRASDNNWSSCASCHYAGTTDNVTWSFGTGPRSTPSLGSSFSKVSTDQRLFNWNGVMGSVTDFNNNSRGVQGGIGHTPNGNADAALVFAHGPSAGVSEALDLMSVWVRDAVRTFNAPSDINAVAAAAGRAVFQTACNSCHGTDLWTTSRILWNRPLFATGTSTTTLDPRVQILGTGPVILAFDSNNDTIFDFLLRQTVGSFDATNPIEFRGGGPQVGQASVGNAGSFNVPSLLGAAFQGPYGHHGRARTLADVFVPIPQGGLGHATQGLSAQDLANVTEFVRSIDSSTPVFP